MPGRTDGGMWLSGLYASLVHRCPTITMFFKQVQDLRLVAVVAICALNLLTNGSYATNYPSITSCLIKSLCFTTGSFP